MPTLQEILRDPNYVNANPATKQAIFERWAPQDPNYATANEATQAAIRQRFGIGGVSAPAAGAPTPAPQEESGFFRQVADVPVGVAKGVAQGVRMIADAFGAGSGASNAIRGVEDFLGGLMSAQAKNDQQEIARIMQEAEDKGAGAQVRAALQAFMTAPVDLISQGLGTAGPVILAGLGAKVLGGGAAVAKGVGLGLGAGMGAGVVKGTIYEETKQALLDAKMPEDQAEARAQLAQSYGGENLDMILAGAALGGLASTTGVEKALTGPLARNILARAGMKEAAKEAAEQGAERMATQGLARRVGTGAVTEAVPEFLQGSQEQLAANLALQREGFDVDTMRGVIGAGTLEGLVGAGMGAGIGAIPTGTARPALEAEQEAQTEEEADTSEEIPPAGAQGSLADILTPPPPPTPEEVRAKQLQDLQTQIEILDQQIQDGESRGTTMTKDEKSELQKLRNNRKKLVKQAAELEAAEVTPPATPLDTTPPTETLGDVPDLSASSAPGQAGALPGADITAPGLSTTTGVPDATQGAQTAAAPGTTQVTPTATGQEPSAAGAAPTVTTQPDMVVPSDVELQRPTGEEVSEEIKQKEAQVAELYEEELEYAKLDDEGANLYDALRSDTLPENMQLGSARLDAVLERNQLTLPDLPDNFDSMSATEQEAELKKARADILQQIDDKRAVLLPWNKLSVDQRQVYLDRIRNNTAEEHANARKALIDYRRRLREAQGKDQGKDLKAAPEAGIYERNRNTYKTRDRLEYPTWDQLTDEQRALYDQTLRNRQPDPKKATAEDHDAAFKAVADKLVQEGYVPTPGKTYADVRAAQLKQSEKASKERAQREIEEERKTAKEGKPKKPARPKDRVPDKLVDKIKEGDTQSVLTWLANSIPNPNRTIGIRLQRAVAGRLKALGLKTKIQFVDSLPDGSVAQYDPQTDTISVTAEGATATDLLHEFVHAATVTILDKVARNDAKGLTPSQIDAANQLDDIMALTASELSQQFPEAFKNVFEFVSYAMSDTDFQKALERQDARGLEYTLMPDRNMLSKFMDIVVDLLKLTGLFGPKGGIVGTPNLLAETIAAFEAIIEAPQGSIDRAAMPSKGPAQQTLTAPDQDNSLEAIRARTALPELSTASAVRRRWTGRKAYNTIRTKFQNSRDVIKRLENATTLAGKTTFAGPKINAVYSSIVRASGIAKDLFLTRVEPASHNLRMAISAYAEVTGLTPEDAARDLHLIAMAKHEPERRAVKYMLNVPLSTTPTAITLPDGSTVNVAPSEFRKNVLNAIYSGKLNKTQVTALRGALDNVVAQHADPSGFSEAGYKSTDVNSEDYNVVGGYSPATMNMILSELETDKTRPAVNKAMKALQALHKETKALDKEANYWSAPVQSVVDFYGWQNYVPLKGKQYTIGKNDDMLNFDSPRLGKDFQELQGAFEGRETDSDNSIIQSMVDSTRAAMRAGRRDVTLAIKNAVKDKLLFGAVVAENVPFADREAVLYDKYRGANFIYHYNADGTVDVIQLSDSAQREAIKRTYEGSQPLIDSLNYVTSKMGQFHTRYNLSFAPMNFIRDALAHAFSMGAEFGPKYAAQYIGSIAARVANGGMFKAAKVARLYENGNFKAIETMAKKDPYVAAMYEYIQEGGKVSYLQGISTKSQQQELQRDLSSSNTRKAGEAINKVFDIWIDTFELSARTAAYEIMKSQSLSEGMSEAEARARATSYTKELANFETVGEWGKAAGAMFMFFRPAATGAVRAIDAVGPAFRSYESAKNELPAVIRNDPEALAKFKKRYEEQQKSARIMSLGLLGLGAMVYMMAYTMSDDDDYGRNKTGTDDMERWQRYARFYIPGTEDALKGNAIQIPWGFGLGAFASAGAQLASLGYGNNSVGDALINSAMAGMDSFLPLPVSQINPMDKPAAWLMDSALPSVMRPFLEWTMNVDGLGREIYNNRPNRFGDAYTGGDNIPETYKAAARMLYDATDGAVDWSPNTLYFFANNYFSGPSRLITGAADIGLATTGQKAFNPKTDTVFFSSFFGTPSNVDAREFADAERNILNIQRRLKTLEAYSPEKYAKYLEENPTHQFVVDSYNTKINQTLRDMRQEANVYRRMQELTPKERNEVVKSLVDVQNLLKRDILNMMDALGLEY